MKIATPHDSFFKYVMSRIEAIHDFIINYLPPHVAQQFDLSSLAIRKDSFIDEKLAEHFSDMLYEINLLDERAGELYLLFEHKSFPKRQTIFDLLRAPPFSPPTLGGKKGGLATTSTAKAKGADTRAQTNHTDNHLS